MVSSNIWGDGDDELTYAKGRNPDRTYASKSFLVNRENSSDFGKPARYVYKVFDTKGETRLELDGDEWVVSETERGRYQFKLFVAREAGYVKELWIQRIPASGVAGKVELKLNLIQPNVGRLVEFLKNLDYIPVEGSESIRVDDALIREVFADPNSLVSVYKDSPQRFRQLITDDVSARDVIAMSHRRDQLEKFRRLLSDDGYFDAEFAKIKGVQREAVWQQFFEENPWIFGVSLTGQFLTSWSDEKLEQVVKGASISSVGKRADGLLRTSGRIKSLVFAEIKTHETKLLKGTAPRTGCWPPSSDLSEAVAQSQGTVHLAVRDIADRLQDKAPDGSDIPGEYTYAVLPRSYLIIGNLDSLLGESGGHNKDKIRSFELYRRQLGSPEILTFDELLARAEWYVTP